MPRIQVLAKVPLENNDGTDYEAMGINPPSVEYKWIRRVVHSEEIIQYDETSKSLITIYMGYGDKFIIKEPFEDFDTRLYLLENIKDFEPEEEEELEVQPPQPIIKEK